MIGITEALYNEDIANIYIYEDKDYLILEWVILLHNCSDSYKKEIYRRFGDIENVMIEERDVNGTGLAYARSELINLVGGKYLFFLDGDDEITPSCIKVQDMYIIME